MPLCQSILHEIKICITENEPFCTGSLKIDLNTGMCTLTFAAQNNAISEFPVPNPLAKADTLLRSSTNRRSTATWP